MQVAGPGGRKTTTKFPQCLETYAIQNPTSEKDYKIHLIFIKVRHMAMIYAAIRNDAKMRRKSPKHDHKLRARP